MIKFNLRKKSLDFCGTPFNHGEINFVFASFSVKSVDLAWKKNTDGYAARFNGCEFAVRIRKDSCAIAVANLSRATVVLKNISVDFAAKHQKHPQAADQWMEYIIGERSGVKKVGLKNRFLDNNPSSSFAYMINSKVDQTAHLFAVLPPHQGDLIQFRALHDSPNMEGNFGLSFVSIQERTVLTCQRAETSLFTINSGRDPLKILEALGNHWRKKRGMPLKDIPIGWNSWSYFAGAVEASDIYKNQKAARRCFRGKIKYFVIDEGYEPRWGVWQANWKFPGGLRAYCRRIKTGGGVPGVWTAPLLVNKYTTLYRKNPHWFARAADSAVAGKNYSYGPMAFLDVTHPEVENFLSATFRQLRQDGFEYFKIDFTEEILEADYFRDRSMPRGGIVRRAYEIIRQAIGDEAYLLACGGPHESVTGIADSVRSTADIHTFWGHVVHSALNISAKWWMHRNLWNNDPDFLVVRNHATCTLPSMNRAYKPKPANIYGNFWRAGREMNTREIKAYALLIYLSGGDVFLGDDICSLNGKGLEIIRKVIDRPLANAAVPVDLFESHEGVPSIWLAREANHVTIGVFNWEEDAREFIIDTNKFKISKDFKVKTFWNDCAMKIEKNCISLDLPPRSGEALVFT